MNSEQRSLGNFGYSRDVMFNILQKCIGVYMKRLQLGLILFIISNVAFAVYSDDFGQ